MEILGSKLAQRDLHINLVEIAKNSITDLSFRTTPW